MNDREQKAQLDYLGRQVAGTAPRTEADRKRPLSWRCWWGFHAWTVWDAPVPGIQQVLNWEPRTTMVQERTCLRCCRTELRVAQ